MELNNILNIAAILFLIGLPLNIGAYFLKKFRRDSHGAAGWMSKIKLKKLLNTKNSGLVIDGINRLSKKDSRENLLIVAPTGQGKSSGFVIPNIISLDNSSSVVVDPSGEVFDSTAAGMQEMGFNIKVWSPVRKSHSFNLLQNVHSIKDAGMVGDSIMSRFANKNNPIWHKSGGTLLQSIFYFLHLMSFGQSLHYKNMDNVLRFLSLSYEDQELLVDYVENQDLSFLYSSFKNANKEAKGGIQLMAKEGVELFLEPNVGGITQDHNFDFKELRNKNTIFYLIFPEMEIEYYSPLLQIFFGQLFHFANLNKDGNDIVTILEEAGNMGYIPNLPKATTTLRKYGVSISLVLQELKQLNAIYGNENAEVIKSGGCVTKLFLPGLGSPACKEISEMLGRETITNESKNKSVSIKHTSSSKTESNMGRQLMTPDEIRMMKNWTAIMVRKNEKPAKLKVKPSFKQRRLEGFLEFNSENSPKLDFNSKETTQKLDYVSLIKIAKEKREEKIKQEKEAKRNAEKSNLTLRPIVDSSIESNSSEDSNEYEIHVPEMNF
jgi:type IV secretion system protein VirD4